MTTCCVDYVLMNRGNHEDFAICNVYGFQAECLEKYDDITFGMFMEVFQVSTATTSLCVVPAFISSSPLACNLGSFSDTFLYECPYVTVYNHQLFFLRNPAPFISTVLADVHGHPRCRVRRPRRPLPPSGCVAEGFAGDKPIRLHPVRHAPGRRGT